MRNRKDWRVLRIGKTLTSFRTKEGCTHIILTEIDTLKYFHTDKFLGSYEFVVYCQISNDTDEVVFMGLLDDYVIRDVQSGNEYCYEVCVSKEDLQFLESAGKAIICYPDNKMYFYLNDPHFQIADQHYYITQSTFSDDEEKLITYRRKKEERCPAISYQDIIKKQAEIEAEVKSLDINSIIDSYIVSVEHTYITKIGGDDKYYVYYNTHCDRYDPYLDSILPSYYENLYKDKGYGIDYESKEDRKKWEEFASKETIKNRESARNSYNQKDHITVLLSQFIMKEEADRYKKLIDFNVLENEIFRVWKMNDMPYLYIDENNYQEKIEAYNSVRKVISL